MFVQVSGCGLAGRGLVEVGVCVRTGKWVWFGKSMAQ